ncbi:hypothetical protein JCM11641_000879 [Rhodosporidiobolus odoratus]
MPLPPSRPLSPSSLSTQLSSLHLPLTSPAPRPVRVRQHQPTTYAIRSTSLTSLEALVEVALPSSPILRGPPAFRTRTLRPPVEEDEPAEPVKEESDEESELPYLSLPVDPLPISSTATETVKTPADSDKRPTRLAVHLPFASSALVKRSTSKTKGTLKTRLGYGSALKPAGKEMQRRKSSRKQKKVAGRGMDGSACGTEREQREQTMEEKGYGVEWGAKESEEEVEEVGASTERPAKRRTPFWPVAKPKQKKPTFSASNRKGSLGDTTPTQSAFRFSVDSNASSESSYAFIRPDEEEKKVVIYHDREDKAKVVAQGGLVPPPAAEQGLSDAETTGENTTKPVSVVPIPSSVPPTAKAKHFRLPTLSSPPISGNEPILLDTPAELTDISFDLSGFPATPGTFVERSSGSPGLFGAASTPGFEEGPGTFSPVLEQDDDEDRPLAQLRSADLSQSSTAGWISSFLSGYDRSNQERSDVASTGSSAESASDDVPLGARLPIQLHLFSSTPTATHPMYAPCPPPFSSPSAFACPGGNPYFPTPGFPFAPPMHPSVAPSLYSANTTGARHRPPPLVDLHALPPIPAWHRDTPISARSRGPGSGPGLPSLIQHVKGRDVPDRVEGARDPMREKWEREGRRRERDRAGTGLKA